jgi:hypothetical protein
MEFVIEKENLGQAAFTKTSLAIYDFLVLQLICRFAWRCPNERVLAAYRRHLSANHLETGVGTGYFPDHAQFPSAAPRVALLDLNANCLERTARRIERYQPDVYQANLLAPIALSARRFDSIAMNYVLHCLPGALPEKGRAIGHLAALLNPGGVLFGATLLQGDVPRSLGARMLMHALNARRTLCNAGDTKAGLVSALEQHLTQVQVEIVGCVALFSGRARGAA